MVSPELTKELQQIIREEFGLDLSVDEAQRVGRELTDYYDLLAEIKHENAEKLNESNSQVEETSNSAIINTES